MSYLRVPKERVRSKEHSLAEVRTRSHKQSSILGSERRAGAKTHLKATKLSQ